MGFPSVVTDYSTSDGTEALRHLLGEQVFSFPKPPGLVRDLILQATGPQDLVLDSFAGSGTTAEAVMRANSLDGGQRRFLAIELSEEVASTITRKRINAVINGHREDGSPCGSSDFELLGEEKLTLTNLRKGPELIEAFNDLVEAHRDDYEEVTKVIEGSFLRVYGRTISSDGLAGGYRYCTLGSVLFDASGTISADVRFGDLAAHVFFSETGTPLQKRASGKTPLLDVHQARAIYLLYNGVLGDRRPASGNVLTRAVADDLPPHPEGEGSRIVYGEACRLGDKALESYGITFRQIPFDLKIG